MTLPIYQVDAFTSRPFAGNPAAVCPIDGVGPVDAHWMQQVAAEMNLSETAFVQRQGEGFALRWFTPTVEVDLCGHATLATAHVLWETGRARPGHDIVFHTRSGELGARMEGGWIWLDFPADPPQPVRAPDGLAAALGVEPLHVGRGRFDLLVELPTAQTVRELAPDLLALGRLPVRGVIVTAAGDRDEGGEIDFVSRFFAPALGIPEDPVTGSAHCTLAPFWHERTGLHEMVGHQVSKRGGTVRVRSGRRVALGGQAVTVLTGELLAL
ncbi:MAG: PhzF family phenazine biosynthesis protein [Nitrospirae bacterium]|nr:PhzF family phenazine biosynthesis protein [Nitrospirota bacterium]